jgi:uncharacterized protein
MSRQGEGGASPHAQDAQGPVQPEQLSRSRWRWAWLLLAYFALGLAVLGVVLPGLPTTPFVLVAAWAAAQGSPRLHAWLLAHPTFGPTIRNWQRYGAVSRKAKWLATVMMVVCALVLWWFAPNAWAHWPPMLIMSLVAIWLWRRPEPPAVEPELERAKPVPHD